jgi:hypothetical protein
MDVDVIGGDLLFSPLNVQESSDDMQYEDSGDEQMLDIFEDGGESEDDLFEIGDDCDLFDADDDCDLFDATLEETNDPTRLLLDTTDTPVWPDDDLLMQECDDRSLDAAIQAKDECKQQHRDRYYDKLST